MDNNLLFTLIFFVILILYIVFKVFLASDEQIAKMAQEAKERKSNEIKRGIQYSKIHGTKKSRKIKNYI